LFIFLTAQLCLANMGSPVYKGTYSSTAFTSRDVDILREQIHLTIDKGFKTARFTIEYVVQTDIEGKQIPLLFVADNNNGDFNIWVDNQSVRLLDIPKEYKVTVNTPFERFKNSFNPISQDNELETVEIS